MKLLAKCLALAAVTAGTMAVSQRAQAQVAVDVDISVGSITILYYHNDIDVVIPDAVLASLFTPVGCGTGGGSVNCIVAPPAGPVSATSPGAGQLNWVGSVDGTPAPADFDDLALNLEDVWAVRALGGASTNTTVTVALGANATISGAPGSIVSSNPRIDDVANACAAGATTVTFADPGLGVATQGSVCLDLNFTNATAGPFDGGADTGNSVYTLQVTGT
jgi:hypothetical protein